MKAKDDITDAKLRMRFTQSITTRETRNAEADALFLSIGEGAIVTDSEANISRINKTAEQILGLKAADVIGKWYPGIVIVEDEDGNVISNMERPMAEVFLRGRTIFRKLYARRSDGTRVALALTVSPVLSEGKPIGAIEVFRDISEEVRLDQAKTEFIALASHQLRTPATAVKQYLNMLIEGYAGKLTDSQRAFISTANEGNERQLKIINDILKVAAADSGDMVLERRKTELGKLIQSVVDEEQPKIIKSHQQLLFRHPTRPVYASIDPHIFRMVLENLIDNAHKYTYPEKRIEVTLTAGGSTTIISIRDEGVGISHSDAKRLFQKFVRLESKLSVSAGGTGLGLYWVKKVLELHGASIAVESQVGKGTVFSITLPESRMK